MQSKIEITIPDNNIIERTYIIDVIFHDFLDISYEIRCSHSVSDYILIFDDRKIIFRDGFWNRLSRPLEYLDLKNLPNPSFTTNNFIIESNIPILYGSDELFFDEKMVICGIDIFASIFFMLTRWEEYVNKTRDQYNRFPATASTAYQHHFLHRPIVNEYVEMLWNMLIKMGYVKKRKKRKFELILTHDIDMIHYKERFKLIFGDIIKRKNIVLALKRCTTFWKNPYDTFDFLMTVSEKIGIKSHFYFMAAKEGLNNKDNDFYIYTRAFGKIVESIKERGHIIGFHPGYESYNDLKIWKEQKLSLETMLDCSVKEGRQHYLMMNIPETLEYWEDGGMDIDSTLGYADEPGFRCGTGDVFSYFNFLRQKKMFLHERPLIVMDGTLKVYKKLSLHESINILHYYSEIGKKYEMPITFLFHNSSFDFFNWNGWMKIYKELVSDH